MLDRNANMRFSSGIHMPIIWDPGSQRQDVQVGLPELSSARWERLSQKGRSRVTEEHTCCWFVVSTGALIPAVKLPNTPPTHIHTHVQNRNLTETCQSLVPSCFVFSLRLREDNSFILGTIQHLTLCLECFSYRNIISTLWMIAVLFYWKCLIWVFSRREVSWLLLWLTRFNTDIKCQRYGS